MSASTSSNNAQFGDTHPLRYEVRIEGSQPIVFQEQAPAFLCIPQPPENETKRFLAQLVFRHQADLMQRNAWQCWRCRRPAVSILHSPMSYLHNHDPLVVDLAQPICQNNGECSEEATAMMAELIGGAVRGDQY